MPFRCLQGGALWFQNLTEIPNGLYGPLFPFLIAGLHYTNTLVFALVSFIESCNLLVTNYLSLFEIYIHFLQIAFSASSVHKVDKFEQLAKVSSRPL